MPNESNVITKEIFKSPLKKDVDRAIDCFIKKTPINEDSKVQHISPREARELFSEYFNEKISGNGIVDAEISSTFFNETYFGDTSLNVNEDENSKDIMDSRAYGHISNMLMYNSPGRERTMERAKELWDFQTHFLTPQKVFKLFSEHPQYGKFIDIKDFDLYKQAHPEHMQNIFSLKYFGIPNDPEERKNHFLNNSIGFFSPDLMKSVYECALKIMKHSQKNDNIVIFGNTPYFVGRALNYLISPENPRHVVIFPFSGAPNGQRVGSFFSPNDLVTTERLEHLKKRLDKAGLSATKLNLSQRKTHFVDVIASGSGLAYVIEEILRDCTRNNLAIPDVDIFCLNKIDIENEEDERNAQIAEHNADDGEQVTFFLPSKNNLHIKVSGLITYFDYHECLDLLPSDDWRILPKFNACYWQDEYNHRLEQQPSQRTQTLLDFADIHIEKLSKE